MKKSFILFFIYLTYFVVSFILFEIVKFFHLGLSLVEIEVILLLSIVGEIIYNQRKGD